MPDYQGAAAFTPYTLVASAVIGASTPFWADIAQPPVAVGAAIEKEDSMTTDQLVALSIQASEAKTDSKFSQLIGKMDLFGEKLSTVSRDLGELKTSIATIDTKTSNTRVIVITTIIGAFLATVGIAYTVASYSVQIVEFVKGATQ